MKKFVARIAIPIGAAAASVLIAGAIFRSFVDPNSAAVIGGAAILTVLLVFTVVVKANA